MVPNQVWWYHLECQEINCFEMFILNYLIKEVSLISFDWRCHSVLKQILKSHFQYFQTNRWNIEEKIREIEFFYVFDFVNWIWCQGNFVEKIVKTKEFWFDDFFYCQTDLREILWKKIREIATNYDLHWFDEFLLFLRFWFC